MGLSDTPRSLPLARRMASVAERHEVRRIVSLEVALTPELTERNDVVHVERSSELGSGRTAIFAATTFLPHPPANRAPVAAVVRLVATTPVRMLFATWGVFLQPVAPATARTEAASSGRGSRSEGAAALFARCLVRRLSPSRDIPDVRSTRTSVGAIDAWPRLHERDGTAAFRTGCRDSRAFLRLLVAGHSAVRPRAVGVALERFVAGRTRSCRPSVFKTTCWHSRILPGFAADMKGVKYA
jgi:hypothetical protein